MGHESGPEKKMKRVGTKQKKTNRLPVIIAGAVILAVLSVGFSCARVGIINIPGITPPAGPENVMTIAYLNAAASSGTFVNEVISFRDVDMDDEYVMIPDDVITPEDDMSGYVLTMDLYAGTPLCRSMVCPVDTDNLHNDTTRDVQIDYIEVQEDVAVGDYVDIRMSAANERDLYGVRNTIVLAKKEVISLDGRYITLRLNEDEQIFLAAAYADVSIVNNAKTVSENEGIVDGAATDTTKKAEDYDNNSPDAKLYTTKYVSYGQKAAQVNYTNDAAVALMRGNPNLINNPGALYEQMVKSAVTDSVKTDGEVQK